MQNRHDIYVSIPANQGEIARMVEEITAFTNAYRRVDMYANYDNEDNFLTLFLSGSNAN